MVPRWQVQMILMQPSRGQQSPGQAEIMLTGRRKPQAVGGAGEDEAGGGRGGVLAWPSLQSRLLVSFLTHLFCFYHPLISAPNKKGRGHIELCSFQLSAQEEAKVPFFNHPESGFTSRLHHTSKLTPTRSKPCTFCTGALVGKSVPCLPWPPRLA